MVETVGVLGSLPHIFAPASKGSHAMGPCDLFRTIMNELGHDSPGGSLPLGYMQLSLRQENSRVDRPEVQTYHCFKLRCDPRQDCSTGFFKSARGLGTVQPGPDDRFQPLLTFLACDSQ